MKTIKAEQCLNDVEVRGYLKSVSARTLYTLRKKHGLPFFRQEGGRWYRITAVNKWILGDKAHLYPWTEPMTFLTPSEAATVSTMSFSSLAHQRVAGKGPPWFRVGCQVRYVPTDLPLKAAA